MCLENFISLCCVRSLCAVERDNTSLQHPVCESRGFFPTVHRCHKLLPHLLPWHRFGFSDQYSEVALISRSIQIGEQLHTKWLIWPEEEKKMQIEISLSVLLWNWGLQLCRRIDWSWTAAVSMSILIQCPSLIVIRLPSSHGPSPSLWEPYYSAPALQPSCDVQPTRRTGTTLYAD